MPVAPTYPGVYVEEIPSGVRTITGVATSITAFVGRALRGPTNEPTAIFNFGDFERMFGGLGIDYPMSYAVRDFYLNGGSQALIVRIVNIPAPPPATPPPAPAPGAATPPPVAKAAEITLPALKGVPSPVDLSLVAASEGTWGNTLEATVDYNTSEVDPKTGKPPADKARTLFSLTITERDAAGNVAQQERFLNVAFDDANARYLPRVLKQGSNLVRVKRTKDNSDWLPFTLPATTIDSKTNQQVPVKADGSGSDGGPLIGTDYVPVADDSKTGIFALEKADLFNLLCIPPDTRGGSLGDLDSQLYAQAAKYCRDRRAMFIVDSPSGWSKNKNSAAADAKNGLADIAITGDDARNAALYFPRIIESDPLRQGQLDTFVPCGVIAGVMARTDVDRGVWKAPAGIDATMTGVSGLEINLTNDENGILNPLGINCLRTFPVYGTIVWGARTMRGADVAADDYKYVPVRRLALYIEESLYRGTQWVVFEPNDEPLWAQIRLNVGAFMHNLFVQGAFQGQTPKDAYFVKCDKESTTQNDINLGIVNVVVGFAPLKPAEFVILKIQQMAGNILT
jgi:uncharacterized protein